MRPSLQRLLSSFSLPPTSHELLLFVQAVAFLVTDLFFVLGSYVLHG